MLEVSQPSVSRTIQSAGDRVVTYRVSGIRTPRYGLLRDLGRVPARQTVYRIDCQGVPRDAGTIFLIEGGESIIQTTSGAYQFAGLPPSMTFASPSGFLGRQIAHEVSDSLGVPRSIRDWQDDHRAIYLFAASPHPPGDLIFGDACLRMALEERRHIDLVVDRPAEYPRRTHGVTMAAAGSSAGGEQPKFLCETEEHGHVIVKYARAGSRAAHLLVMEQLALQAVEAAGIPAATTDVVRSGDMVFLEVQRFDRVGRHGRIGMLSAGALDDEVFGKRDSWSAFAQRCVEARYIDESQADIIHLLAAVSELIGNTDTHFENIALLLDAEGQPASVAPAYDLLPMMYGSVGGGIDPPLRPIEPKLGHVGGRMRIWRQAHLVAQDFWGRAANAEALPPEFRELARVNGTVARDFVLQMIPDADTASAPAPAGRPKRPRI